MILILKMGLVEAYQQKIVKVSGLFLELWNDGDFRLSVTGKRIVKQRLTGSVIVVFFGHKEASCMKQAPSPPTYRLPIGKVIQFRAAT